MIDNFILDEDEIIIDTSVYDGEGSETPLHGT